MKRRSRPRLHPNRLLFAPALNPLLAQEYVLRMAMSRDWSRTAQVKHLTLWREALCDALSATERALDTLKEAQR